MPGGNNNRYTFVAGSARFIAINTEVYYISEGGGPKQVNEQIDWLRDVLEKANSPIERETRPWIILMGHRPLYCSNGRLGRCPGGSTWVID